MNEELIKEQIKILCEEFGVKLLDGELVFPSYLKEELDLSETFKIPANKTLH